MNKIDHPIYIEHGFQIYTRPTEYLANFIRANIAEGHHGCSAHGGGGLGKTSSLIFLTENVSRWLVDEVKRPIGVAARMTMPAGIRRSDRAFWVAVNQRLKLPSNARLDPGTAIERLVGYMSDRCGQAKQRRMVLFIDNAQRITDAEFHYLEDLDTRMSEEGLSLFLVLMRQSDAQGIDIGDDWRERPSHTVRRWFMDTTAFRPLVGIAEVTHALARYDRSAFWPTPDMPFSRFFAKEAFDAGWTLASEAAKIDAAVKQLRKHAKLPPSNEWPMATFSLCVRNLLEIASREKPFQGFSEDQILRALNASGYVRLECVRAKVAMPASLQRVEAPLMLDAA
jgi:hypothetical protein